MGDAGDTEASAGVTPAECGGLLLRGPAQPFVLRGFLAFRALVLLGLLLLFGVLVLFGFFVLFLRVLLVLFHLLLPVLGGGPPCDGSLPVSLPLSLPLPLLSLLSSLSLGNFSARMLRSCGQGRALGAPRGSSP